MKGVFTKYRFHAILIVIIAIIYGNTLNHDYALDDVIVVTENSRVQNGLGDIPSFFKNIKSEQTQHRYGYRPISLLSFATVVHFFGLDSLWQHLLNVILYALLCILLYQFLRRLFTTIKPEVLAFAVLIYTVHPLHTEVVANIKSRDEILAMIFGICYLWFLLSWLKSRKIHELTIALVFSILAFMSKENAIGYIAMGLILPLVQNPNLERSRIIEMLPSAVSIAILLIVYALSQSFLDENSMILYEKGLYHEDRFVANPLVDHSLWSRVMHAFLILGYEIKLFLIPHPLIHDYGFQTIDLIESVVDWRWIVSFILTISSIVIAVFCRKSKPIISFGILFWLITTTIYLHVPIAGPDFFGERFLFGPSLGLSLILARVLWILSHRSKWALLIIIPLTLSGLTYFRALDWKSTNVLFEADKSYLKNCARFQYNYARMLHHSYYSLPSGAQKREQQIIISHYENAIEITDRLLLAYLDLGGAYMEFGNTNEAHAIFLETVEKYNHLSAPHYQLGQFYLSQNMLKEALQSYTNALEKGEKNASTYYMKAICEIKLGKPDIANKTLLAGKPYSDNDPRYLELMKKLNGL